MYQSFTPRYAAIDGGLVTSDGISEVRLVKMGEVGLWYSARPRDDVLNYLDVRAWPFCEFRMVGE